MKLEVEQSKVRQTILEHPEFRAFVAEVEAHFKHWQEEAATHLKSLGVRMHPKQEIVRLSESLLAHFQGMHLLDAYSVYQHLMDYWASTMQDDCYLIAADGWKAEVEIVTNKKGKAAGWTCDLVPKELVIARYFQAEQDRIIDHRAKLEAITAEMDEMEEEQGGEEGVFSDLEKVNLASVKAHMKSMAKDADGLMPEEVELLKRYLELAGQEQTVKQWLKAAEAELDQKLLAKFKALTENEIKMLVVDDKWLATIEGVVQSEVDRLSQALSETAGRLAKRYSLGLPEIDAELTRASNLVSQHLEKMGISL